MGSPAIFAGRRAKLLTADGLLTNAGRIIDYDGLRNYIANNSAEVDITGWATYADAAGTSPVDGTGGSAASAFTRSTSSPLIGQASFLWTKSAANRQGEGFSYDFSIQDLDKGKVLACSLDYSILSGTFASGDMTFWIYDVTNSVLIQPAPYSIQNHTLISDRFFLEFQTASNSNSYRLICHTSTTSASAYTLKFDNFLLGPQNKLYGTNYRDTVLLYQNTGTSATTAGTDVLVALANIASAKGNYSLTSNGTAIKYTERYKIRLKAEVFGNGEVVTLKLDINGSKTSGRTHTVDNNASGSYSTLEDSFVVDLNAGDVVKFYINQATTSRTYQSAEMHIEQITSQSLIASSDAATRAVAARAYVSSGASTTSSSPINFDTIDYDTHGMITTGAGTWKATARVPGYYKVTISLYTGGASTNLLYKNGSAHSALGTATVNTLCSASTELFLNAGDYVEMRPGTTVTPAAASPASLSQSNWITVEQLQGPAQILASDFVGASYSVSANFAASTTVPINFDTKEYDSHGSVVPSATVWKFTAPTPGTYQVSSVTSTSSAAVNIQIYKNGSAFKTLGAANSAATLSGATTIKLLAGEYMDIRPSASATILGGSLATNTTANLSIIKIGNY
jgi:hypothetical protein